MLNRFCLLVLFFGGCATPQPELSDAASDQPNLPTLPENERRLGDTLPGLLARKPLINAGAEGASKGAEASSVDLVAKPSVENEPPIGEGTSSKQEEASKKKPPVLSGLPSNETSKQDLPELEAIDEFPGKEKIKPTEDNEPADGGSPSANKPPLPSANGELLEPTHERPPSIKSSETPPSKGSESSLQENVTTVPPEEKTTPEPEEPSVGPSPQNDLLLGEVPSSNTPAPPAEESQSAQLLEDGPVVPSSKQDSIEEADHTLPTGKEPITETNIKESSPVDPRSDASTPPAEESQRPRVRKEDPVTPLSKGDVIAGVDHPLAESSKEPIAKTNNREETSVVPESLNTPGPRETRSVEKTLKNPSTGSVPIDREQTGGRPRIYFNRPEPTEPSEGGRGLRPRFLFRKLDASSSTAEKNPRARLSFGKTEKSADSSEGDAGRPTWSSLLRPSSDTKYGSSNQPTVAMGDDYSEGSMLGLNWNLAASAETNPQTVASDHGVKWQLRDNQKDGLLTNAQYMSSENYKETIRWLKWKPRTRDFEILDLDFAFDSKPGHSSSIRWLKWKPRARDFEISDLPLGPTREYSKTVKWLRVKREP